MKKLHFDYRMEIIYSEPVERCNYTLKCVPGDTEMQRVEHLVIELLPENRYCQGTDSFGNKMLYGSIEAAHDCFSCHIEGEVETGLSTSEEQGAEELLGKYRYPHGAAVAGEGLRSYYGQLSEVIGLRADGEKSIAAKGKEKRSSENAYKNAYEAALGMMHRLHQDFRYKKQITNLWTTAEEAWQLGCGVCQDYAHILIVLCRMHGIPARYVAGLMMGEGESHAWVEVLSEGRWYGLDPTNDLVVNEDYIRLGVGRGAADCALNKGIIVGGGFQGQKIAVTVQEI